MLSIGFKEARRRVIQSLEEGSFLHEARKSTEVKNLLAVGRVGVTEVIDILKGCRGQHHTTSPHHVDSTIEVHIVKPDWPEKWYIKFYFPDPDAPDTMFISVHPESKGKSRS